MAPRIKTSQRIVNSSLELFNQLGERSVSTNHIAAHMEISPGNLYYHFPNKQAIISVLFSEYEALVLRFLRPPEGRMASVEDKRHYLQQLLDAMWRYRFLYRDIEHLLHSDSELAARYRVFSQNCLHQAQAIYRGFVDAGIAGLVHHAVLGRHFLLLFGGEGLPDTVGRVGYDGVEAGLGCDQGLGDGHGV